MGFMKMNRRTEVCRYWLKNMCRKGDACEFLHALDYEKMPLCSSGDFCSNVDCQFKHRPVEGRSVCANYQLGFCYFGRRCPHLHVFRDRPPQISEYWAAPVDGAAAPDSLYAAVLHRGGPLFRKKACDYFKANKWCPYFDMCNFSHVQ